MLLPNNISTSLKFFQRYSSKLFLLNTLRAVIYHYICFYNRFLSAPTDKIIGIIRKIRLKSEGKPELLSCRKMDRELISCCADSKHDKNILVGGDEMERAWSTSSQTGPISIYNTARLMTEHVCFAGMICNRTGRRQQ
jgi:hypothetical protein